VIQEVQRSHTSGTVIVHVLQLLVMKQIVHTQHQPKQMQRQRHIIIKRSMHSEVEVIVQQQRRHGIM
jgi:hypothetical protein